MKKITPFLWFDSNAAEAVNFYVTLFGQSRILSTHHYGEDHPTMAGKVMTINFLLNNQELTALNGGPHFKINPAISFVIHCENQFEVDHYWEKLSDGGVPMMCGWVTDRFGLTWQVVPTLLFELMNDPDKNKVNRVVHAMMQMQKFSVQGLKDA